ncbi:hypothetical protein AX14_010019 [Amanita brunnescens Koide BX004]|nr:hypothetical protein AX14_010019 [Amanita brunnescens Koide BX004]
MPIARGTLRGGGSQFRGQFNPEGFGAACLGSFAQYLPQFNVPNATITYNDLTDFGGPFTIVLSSPPSYVGQYAVDIKFNGANGAVLHVTGELETPIEDRYTVSGRGLWPLGLGND